tara:strand:- start:727 stop:1656 length:930 start_codon:yes stop_codon:yes gene_type:complete
MIKKLLLIFFIFTLKTLPVKSSNSVSIVVLIDDKIITSHDIKNESEYLKIFNPNLEKLEEKKLLELSKNSLINEIIKKNEIDKLIDFKESNPFVDDYLKSLYLKIGIDNENQFKNFLNQKKSYSFEEIKLKIKIELMWNELIYLKYKNQIKIDKNELLKKINLMNNKTRQEYLLSEIVFEKKKNTELKTLINNIKTSISEIGFNNTANIYSISESSKYGGKIGWVDENNLSQTIFNNLKKINKGEVTDVIQIGNNYLLLKIEEIKKTEISINKKVELEKMIKFESNKQLNQYSRIFFNKVKLNYSINEK